MVEEAGKSAIESCYKVLNLLSHHQQQPLQSSILREQTNEAVYRFRRVVSLLSSRLGHGRYRKLKNSNSVIPSLPQNIFLDSPVYTPIFSPKPLQTIPADFFTTPDHVQSQQNNLQFLQQQRVQFQQQNKFQGMNLKFDGRSTTPTMSSNKSSLSLDCSVTNFESFHLIGVPQPSNRISHQSRRRCSVKCAGKCHCSKRRY